MKRKRPVGGSAPDQPAQKKQKTNTGEVAVLSSNVCGFSAEKWANLKQMADTHAIDLITIQEGAPKKTVDGIVGTDWESFVLQEAPYAKKIGNTSVPPQVGVCRFNVILKRKTTSDLTVTPLTLAADQSHSIQAFVLPETQATEPGKRARKAPVNTQLTNQLGVRAPQKVEITIPGCQSLSLYNYHAPQGSGSMLGYSGMQARTGHEILCLALQDDNTPHQVVVGDQNAHPSSMRDHYKNFSILSATTAPTELCHAAIPSALNPQPIDLGAAGLQFNNKGLAGCSDHPPYAFKFTLPSSS